MTFPLGGMVVIENPATIRASAILPAVGAWDPTPIIFPMAGFGVATLFFAYTRGGAGGAFDWYLEGTPYAIDVIAPLATWFQSSLYAPAILAAGVDSQSRIQREYFTYQAVGGAIETFAYGALRLLGTVERLRLFARESGNVGAPGTLQVMALLETDV
jgi:hypothetical protein